MEKNVSYYIRNPNIVVRKVDEDTFLVDPATDTVFYLNYLGSGIWNVLKHPIILSDVIEILQQAFPELPFNRIEADVSDLINKMRDRNLIHIDS